MKKISQIQWQRYKNSEIGKKSLDAFNNVLKPNSSNEEVLALATQYDSTFFDNNSKKELLDWQNVFNYYDGLIGGIVYEDNFKVEKLEDLFDLYCRVLNRAITDEDVSIDVIPQSAFKDILPDNIAISTYLFLSYPSFFLPNFFVTQFLYLEKFAKKYEIDLPKVPNRSDYFGRCLYYWDICMNLSDFFFENGIEAPAERCAFIFDYEFPVIKEEIENAMLKDLPETPEQAWLLVGNYGEGERNMESGLWQANQMTSRGDVMMFYEKSPVKKMNAAWIALEDGRIDPFAYYYSYTYIGKKIEIPDDQAITFQEFKNCEYFKVENHGSKGNFVSKNFQDTSGWAIPFNDYAEIKRMLGAKGFDVSVLPSLYEPEGISAENIENENDVYDKLVTPLLEQMGWKLDVDFKREVEFAAGHSTTGHAMNKRPDYCLHLSYNGNKVYTKVVIEAKYFIKNNIELHDTFDQCLTYASWGQAKVLVLCDKNSIYVYEQNRNGQFEEGHHRTRYRWPQMKDPEIFKELKRKLDI